MMRFLILSLVLVAALVVAETRLDLGLCSADKPCKLANAYCRYPAGSCGQGVGTCEEFVEACTKEFVPVCGCDGNTYSNDCMARIAGVSVRAHEACNETKKDTAICAQDEDCPVDGHFCKREVGKCYGSGACTAKPLVCSMIYSPVCGCDGQTYASECVAASNGVSVTSAGECPEVAKRDECSTNADCEDGLYCRYASGCSGTGVCSGRPHMCPMVYSPVCGCDGTTYSNACRAGQSGVSLRSTNSC